MVHSLLLAVWLWFAPWLTPGAMEARAFYHPGSKATATPEGYEDVWFPTPGGLRLHGWFIPAEPRGEEDAPTVLHVHGNSGDIGSHRFACEYLAREGFNVMLFDYRGFGRSDRTPGLLRRGWLVEDTEAAIEYLLTREDVDPARVAVFGYSLGAVLGLDAAVDHPEVRAVVAFAGFASWEGVAEDKAGLLGRLLIAPGHDAVDAAAGLGDRPLLVVHGTRDRLVDPYHGELIRNAAEQAGVPAELMRVEGGTHISLGRDPRVRAAVVEFLREHLTPIARE